MVELFEFEEFFAFEVVFELPLAGGEAFGAEEVDGILHAVVADVEAAEERQAAEDVPVPSRWESEFGEGGVDDLVGFVGFEEAVLEDEFVGVCDGFGDFGVFFSV